MRAFEFITEAKRKKRRPRWAAWGPGPYGGYGYATGYSGDSSSDAGGDGGGGGESIEHENFADGMSTEDMIAYLKQHHNKNLHSDYVNHITSTNSKFVLKNIPLTSIRTELSGLDREKVEQYKKMDFSKAPPIVVGSDGNILDGYHRATVAKALNIPFIKAYVGVKDQKGVAENFADGDKPGRKGLAKRSGVNCKASVSSLRKTAKNSSGEKARMAHWCANMKSGKKK
jgi:hypothetical protein